MKYLNSKILFIVCGWWFKSVDRLKLSHPSLASVGAGTELGNTGRVNILVIAYRFTAVYRQ